MIVCKSPRRSSRCARANVLVAEVLAELAAMVGPGVTTADLDATAERLVLAAGRRAGVQGLPRLSGDALRVGERRGRARHPGEARARRGRHHLARHGREARRLLRRLGGHRPGRAGVRGRAALLRVTQESLEKGIEQVRLGGRVSDIGHAIQEHVEAHGFSVVREFVGHGIGAPLHEEPQIANYGEPGRGPRLAEGMVLAIEPMVNMGRPAVKVLARRVDGGDARRQPVGALRATVAVTKNGPLVLTERVRRRRLRRGRKPRGRRREWDER